MVLPHSVGNYNLEINGVRLENQSSLTPLISIDCALVPKSIQSDPIDWTFHYYVKKKILPRDWRAEGINQDGSFGE